jgi:hypothetical protein
MRTDDLISLLATDTQPVPSHTASRRFGTGLILGAIVSVALTLWIFGMRQDIGLMLHTPLFWAKVTFPVITGAGALMTLLRLARPGLTPGRGWMFSGVAVIALWACGLSIYLGAPEAQHAALLWGVSWRTCPFNILLLSVPTFAGAFWAVKGMAPVNLRRAGAAAGLVASSIATIAYCLHCPEMGVPFWAVWYVVGMAVTTAVGALLGPKLLRW